MALKDGQFSIDGYVFGHPDDDVVVLTEGWDIGEYDIRDQDAVMPLGDTVAMGRDYFTPGTWTFTLGVRNRAGGSALGVLARLATVWRGDANRLSPGEVSEIRYARDGEERCVYGRPRKFAVETEDVWDSEWKIVTATFRLSDPLTYSGTGKSLTLDLVQTSSATGLVFPTMFDWRFSSSYMRREGRLTISTDIPTPFIVHIYGPTTGEASNFHLSGAGWEMNFPTTLGANGNIWVNTMVGYAKRNSVPFGLGAALTNYRARLAPGPQEIVFSADDPSYTCRAVITWRDVSPVY